MIDSAGVWPTHLLLGFLRFIVVGIGRRERPAVATDKPHLQAPFGRFKWRLLATPRACMRPHLKIAGVVQCQPNLCFLRLRPQPPPTPGPTTCCRHHKVRVCSAQYQDPLLWDLSQVFLVRNVNTCETPYFLTFCRLLFVLAEDLLQPLEQILAGFLAKARVGSPWGTDAAGDHRRTSRRLHAASSVAARDPLVIWPRPQISMLKHWK